MHSPTSPARSRGRKRFTLFFAAVFAFISLGLTPAVAVDQRTIDIVQVGWNGASAVPADAQAMAKIVDTDVNARWRTYTTLVGDTKDRVISFVSGRVLTTPLILNSRMACVGTASNIFMQQVRAEAYKRLAITDFKDRYLIIVSPNAGCVWSGRAQMGDADSRGGTIIMHDSASAFVIAHELGHTFGLGHTSFLRCASGRNDGPWGDDCKAVEYGGTIDAMGNVDTPSPLNTYHQWRMGYLDDSQVKQVWKNETIQLSPSDFADGTRALFIRDGSAVYWVEYRRTIPGVAYNAGLVLYRLDPPPASSVVSPNPEDLGGFEFGDGVGEDLWMVNLDNYTYTLSRTSGSMTGNSAQSYSGNVSISAVPNGTGAAVTVTRKDSQSILSRPQLTDLNSWSFPNVPVLRNSSNLSELGVSKFEISVDGVVSEVLGSADPNWYPTYLNPFNAPKLLRVKDLPEGSYQLEVRSVDLAGNKSPWSLPVKVTIDRGYPVVSNSFTFVSAEVNDISIAWSGTKDLGSGLCQTNIVDSDGLLLQTNKDTQSPTIKLKRGESLNASAQVFDCLGNGIAGDLSISNNYVPADKSSRTGKWSPAGGNYGPGALKCVGKCSASFSTRGDVDLLVGTGSADVSISGKVVAKVSDSKVNKIRVGATITGSNLSRVIRVTGNNLTLVGTFALSAKFSNSTQIDRIPSPVDVSLQDPKQLVLSRFGFNSDDFDQRWSVLPMSRGTTLLDPSFDLCSANYSSEKNRSERRQVSVVKDKSEFSFLSSEVVRYNSTASAMAAQAELVKAVAQCEKEGGFKDSTGTLTPYKFKTIKSLPTGLVPESSRVMVHTVIGAGESAQELLGFYQFSGEIFTGLYLVRKASLPFTDLEVAKWLRVATTFAGRLQGNSA